MAKPREKPYFSRVFPRLAPYDQVPDECIDESDPGSDGTAGVKVSQSLTEVHTRAMTTISRSFQVKRVGGATPAGLRGVESSSPFAKTSRGVSNNLPVQFQQTVRSRPRCKCLQEGTTLWRRGAFPSENPVPIEALQQGGASRTQTQTVGPAEQAAL